MATTCFIARSAENAVGGAFSGMAPGGRLTCSANTMQIATNKNAIANRSIVRCLIAGKICCRYKLSIETHSLPALARCYPHSFTFYVAYPIRSILTCSPRDEPAVVGRAVDSCRGGFRKSLAEHDKIDSKHFGSGFVAYD